MANGIFEVCGWQMPAAMLDGPRGRQCRPRWRPAGCSPVTLGAVTSASGTGPPEPGRTERADARRNRQALLEAAAECVRDKGAEVSALDIAEHAGVSVATLYRRFVTKEALIEQVLADLLTDLTRTARSCLTASDPWAGLAGFITAFARTYRENHGLSQALGPPGTPERLAALHRELRDVIRQLTERAQRAGAVRPDVSWQDIAFLPRTALTAGDCIGLHGGDRQWERCLTLTLDGLRSAVPTPLPGRPGRVPPGP